MEFNENKAVAQLSELLALEMGKSADTARQIKTAAILHDCGKTMIPTAILNKHGKLTAEEFEVMKRHTKFGAEILSSLQGTLGEMATRIALYHHEWHNPSFGGYWGVPTYILPDYVSIVSICDVFTALCSRRCYKAAWPPKKALDYIKQQAGTQFSEKLVEVFIPMILKDSRVPAIFYQ